MCKWYHNLSVCHRMANVLYMRQRICNLSEAGTTQVSFTLVHQPYRWNNLLIGFLLCNNCCIHVKLIIFTKLPSNAHDEVKRTCAYCLLVTQWWLSCVCWFSISFSWCTLLRMPASVLEQTVTSRNAGSPCICTTWVALYACMYRVHSVALAAWG